MSSLAPSQPTTGVLRFDASRGVFIRADEAHELAWFLGDVADRLQHDPSHFLDADSAHRLRALAALLRAPDAPEPEGANPPLRAFDACRAPVERDAPDGPGWWWVRDRDAPDTPDAAQIVRVRVAGPEFHVSTTDGTFGFLPFVFLNRPLVWTRAEFPHAPAAAR